ncbi:alanine--tRNA ligase [bacterium]|nr:alanine--tRNA ligase [bacterium]
MTKPTSINDIRRAFLDYFAGQGHKIMPSSPLVPHQDPTLMFTNSGMVQFKDIFTGKQKPESPRATTAQKCVRAGGKHNDLDNVGYTARHHTFFEMLGNFSFGDYFKTDAIPFAWKFLTEVLGLPKEKLLVTVYHNDEEAYGIWNKTIGLPPEKIIRISTSDNFWSMGDTGPCGPCSEIFYDHGPEIPGGPPGSPDEDGDRFIEVWNLVFMQYEQFADGKREKLPKPSIDTGMGLERIAAVLQGVHNNYETDLFVKLINAAERITGVKAEGKHTASFRVIADHLRASSFLMADGVVPSNEGRGYVLRRIMRRAMRHVHHIGYKGALMHQLFPALVTEMGEAYPELGRASAFIQQTLKSEEERFQSMLGRGMALLEDESKKIAEGGKLSGEVAFKLYDTFGFPVDLTADILRGQGKQVDQEGFDAAMARQKAEARKAWSGSGEKGKDSIWFGIKEQTGASEFLGYRLNEAQGVLKAIVVDGKQTDKAAKGQKVALVFNQTPFYGESGGQMGDKGTITFAGGAIVDITDTQKPLEEFLTHIGTVKEGSIAVGDAAELKIDIDHRDRTRANHSATHLLHAVLRRQLGGHVTQQGSMVSADRLRFDFSHNGALSREEWATIEAEVNRLIWQNSEVSTVLSTPDQAIEAGAMALFGEKYGDEVRVLSMGLPGEDGKAYSVELCGGTHVARTGDIGLFTILSESSVSAGVRRIEACTREGAWNALKQQQSLLLKAAGELRTGPNELPDRVATLSEQTRNQERELQQLKTKLATMGSGGGAGGTANDDKPETIGSVSFIGRVFDDLPAKELRNVADQFRAKLPSGVLALVSRDNGKAAVVVSVSNDLLEKLNAVDAVTSAVQAVGGQKGGGRPDFAQGGGPNADAADQSIEAVRHYVKAIAS